MGARDQVRRLPHAALIDGRDIKLLTRIGLDWSHRYRRTIVALRELKVKSAYIDGELCALNADGVPVFRRLQAAMDEGRTDQLLFFAFDLLFLNGQSTAQLPLTQRKEKLKRLFKKELQRTCHRWRPRFREQACKLGLECHLEPRRSSLRSRRPRDLAEVEVLEPRGVRGRRLDRPRGQPITHRRS